MDEQFVVELIEDLEHMRQTLDRCVRRLRTQLSGEPVVATPTAQTRPETRVGSDIRAEIERQRCEIMSRVEQVKAQALQAASAARSGMPAMGAGAGMAEMAGVGPSTPEALEALRRQITKMAHTKLEEEKKE